MSNDKKRMEFKLPLFSALTEPVLLMGAPPFMIVFNICVAGVFVLSFHFFWVIPLNIAIHAATIYVTKQDADAFECLRSYMQQGRTYNV
ncbi:VirB3 family type IV secretion system protein [Selenomonas sp. FC4001]|uniref:VirB3 family type IV secretion system protein n=1 Tax=Selenomonas sp. FC4001 TaxID=1408313 RepID=UPI000568C762|nr:VirB3 family type IV secretion system protein [Selenomonas sp. FC4001]